MNTKICISLITVLIIAMLGLPLSAAYVATDSGRNGFSVFSGGRLGAHVYLSNSAANNMLTQHELYLAQLRHAGFDSGMRGGAFSTVMRATGVSAGWINPVGAALASASTGDIQRMNSYARQGLGVVITIGIRPGVSLPNIRGLLSGDVDFGISMGWHISGIRAQTAPPAQTGGGQTVHAPATFSITTTATPSRGGNIVGGGTVSSGANVSLTARAMQGFEFTGWYENNRRIGERSSITFYATSNRSIEARFRQLPAAAPTPQRPALTVQSYTDGRWAVAVPSHLQVNVFTSATSTSRFSWFSPGRVSQLNATRRLVMSDGSIRFRTRASHQGVEYTVYFVLASGMTYASSGTTPPQTTPPQNQPQANVPTYMRAQNNGSWQDANAMTANVPMVFTITANNHENWFRVEVPAVNQTISLSIDKVAGGRFENIVQIFLYDEATVRAGRGGNALATLTSWGTSGHPLGIATARDNMNWRFTEAGTYYIRVRGGINLSDLRLQFTLINSDAHGNNTSWQNATPFQPNSPLNFTITAPNDVSWFRVEVPAANQTISLSIDKVAGGRFENIVQIFLYDEATVRAGRGGNALATLASWGTSGWPLGIATARDNMNWRFTEAGIYYIRVMGGINLSELRLQYTLN